MHLKINIYIALYHIYIYIRTDVRERISYVSTLPTAARRISQLSYKYIDKKNQHLYSALSHIYILCTDVPTLPPH